MFAKLAKKRRSVRAYKPDAVEEDKLTQVLEAASLAPTACNYQPFQLIVIRTAGRKGELKRIYKRGFFIEAPLIICICALPGQAWSRMDGVNYAIVDATIAMDHLILAATELGLGTCWIAAFDPDAAREILKLPPGVEPIAFTPLGYPADQPGEKKRKPLSQMIRYDQW